MKLNENSNLVDNGESAVVTHSPQCIECVNNMGLMNCSALATKPLKYIMNEEPCPMRKIEIK